MNLLIALQGMHGFIIKEKRRGKAIEKKEKQTHNPILRYRVTTNNTIKFCSI